MSDIPTYALTYIQYVKERYPEVHEEADGTPSIEALIREEIKLEKAANPKKPMNVFNAGEVVYDIEDDSRTEWTVWEQKGEYVLLYVLYGSVTVKPTKGLRRA